MHQHMVLLQRTALINGIPVKLEITELQEPKIEKVMATVEGGGFGKREVWVGMEAMSDAKFTLKGATPELMASLGLHNGQKVPVNILDSLQDGKGTQYKIEHNWEGDLKSAPETGAKATGGDSAMSARELVFAALDEAEKIVNGKVEYRCNAIIDEYDLGDGDVMLNHRRSTGQP
ncbi:phage major tail tube protein [Vibrio splendidus]|uniref:phage major tail tube protein n=1 Tax=Vibrio splendidus TaxID=29497 RepID=UPI00352E34FF